MRNRARPIRIGGAWRLVAISQNGSAWEEKRRDPLSLVSYMVFSGDEVRVRFRAERQDLLCGKFDVDPTSAPKQLNLRAVEHVKDGIAQERMMPCIFELKDDSLTFAIGMPKARPTELKPAVGVVLQRFERVPQDALAKALEGEWDFVSTEQDGEVHTAEDNERVVRVFEDGLSISYVNGESLTPMHYTIAERQGVHEIDLTDELSIFEKKPETFLGIYSITGDTLKMCIARRAGAPRPKTFTTNPDSNTRVTILKRRDNGNRAKGPR